MKHDSYYHQKVILITGSASGIGKRFAEMVSVMGISTLILWDRNPDTLREIGSELGENCRVICTGVDVSDMKSVRKSASEILDEGLVPDIIVNCAGIVVGKMFHEHSMDEIESTIQINSTGSMWVVSVFLQQMIERGTGHVVNLASASGYIGNPRMSVYAASKWAVIGWSESLRLELEKLKTGIKVTAVIPSYIKTGMFDGVKAPLLVPLLETDQMVNKMLEGVARQKKKIEAPFMVKFVPLIKALLPASVFDWVAGNLLGVYRSMESFKGRNK